MAEKHLYCFSGLPGPIWAFVSALGAFIQQYTVFQRLWCKKFTLVIEIIYGDNCKLVGYNIAQAPMAVRCGESITLGGYSEGIS